MIPESLNVLRLSKGCEMAPILPLLCPQTADIGGGKIRVHLKINDVTPATSPLQIKGPQLASRHQCDTLSRQI